MNIATAITTAPREEYWLSRCVSGLIRASLPEPYFVFAEPDSLITESVLPHVIVRQHRERMGAWRNWVAALDETLQLAPSADAVLVVQDDTLLCRDAGTWLASRSLPPQCGCVSVYTSRGYSGYCGRGLQRLPSRFYGDFWGACALLFPRASARLIVRYAAEAGWRGHATVTLADPREKRGIDAFVGTAVQSLGCEIWICNPSLARHDVEHSTLGHGQSTGYRRRALDYRGDDVSAFAVMEGTP
jgi:hypothetical protein